jgi:hypothetical protein
MGRRWPLPVQIAVGIGLAWLGLIVITVVLLVATGGGRRRR